VKKEPAPKKEPSPKKEVTSVSDASLKQMVLTKESEILRMEVHLEKKEA